MASNKHCSAVLDTLNGEEVPIKTTPQEVLSFMKVEVPSHPPLAFSMRNFPPKEPLTLDLYKSPLGA